MIGGLIAGLVGGGAAWLALSHLAQPKVDAELQTLETRVGQLDGGVAGLKADHQALAQLSGRVQALEQTPAAADGDLAARVEALETARPAGVDQAPALAALTSRLDAIEQGVSATGASAANPDLEAFRTRLTTLEDQLANLATDLAGAGDARAGDVASLEELQSRLGAIESRLAAAGATTERIEGLSARVDALEPAGAKLAQLTGEVGGVKDHLNGLAGEVEGLGQQVQTLHGDLEGLRARLAESQDRAAAANDRRAQAAALALITAQIDAALGQDTGYEAPLRSLTALGDQDQVVAQAAADLAPHAATGVPDLAALRQSFAAVAGEIVQQERAPEGDSLIDRATSNLLRLVTVRPVGADVEGEGAAPRVARAEADLDQGDLAAAVAEIEALEGPAAAAAADWLADARARLQATAALASLRAHVTTLLTPGG